MFDLNQDKLKIKAAKFLNYFQKPISRITEIILLIAFTAVAYMFLLYCAKYLWVLFTATDVGQAYAEIYVESYRITNDVLNRGIFSLSMSMTLTSCVICLIVGAVFKFLHIIQYFYSARGFLGRIIFTGLPLTYIVTVYMYYTGNFSHIDTAMTVVFVPTLCVFTGCFRFAEEFVPELVDLIFIFSGQHRKISSKPKEGEVRSKADELIQKKDTKQSSIDWQIMSKDILESFAAYIIVILVIIVFAGIMFVIPHIQNFNKSAEPALAEAPKDKPPVAQSGALGLSDAVPGSAKEWYDKALVLIDNANRTDFLKSIEYLNEAIRLKPDYVDAHRKRGFFYAKLEQYELAINDYDEVIRLKPNDGSAYNMRGHAYFSQDNISLGCSDARKACTLGNCKLLELTKSSGYCR
jgi:tetratricopeptide (TPR) repeat protein